jgi:hypothetical protein
VEREGKEEEEEEEEEEGLKQPTRPTRAPQEKVMTRKSCRYPRNG